MALVMTACGAGRRLTTAPPMKRPVTATRPAQRPATATAAPTVALAPYAGVPLLFSGMVVYWDPVGARLHSRPVPAAWTAALNAIPVGGNRPTWEGRRVVIVQSGGTHSSGMFVPGLIRLAVPTSVGHAGVILNGDYEADMTDSIVRV